MLYVQACVGALPVLTKPGVPERHPDNVAAALFGGFVATYSRELSAEDLARKEIPLSEILPAPAGGLDTGFKPPEPPIGIGHYMQFPLAPEIKAIVVIPDFEVPTSKARDVLPQTYSRADVVGDLCPFSPCLLQLSIPSVFKVFPKIDS